MNISTQNLQHIAPNNWLFTAKKVNRPNGRLYCFPFAGGNNTAFRGWERTLANDLELTTITLPGRGIRREDPYSHDLVAMSHQIADAIQCHERGRFAFFGHSMGAVLAYETSIRLRERGAPMPVHLFVSGRQAPHITDEHQVSIEAMDDAQFLSQVISLNGIPDEVLAVPELMTYYLPVLKADYIAVRRWTYTPAPPLAIPITVLTGSEDPIVTADEIRPWREHTLNRFRFLQFSGNHFFFRDNQSEILDTISQTLSAYKVCNT